MVIIADSSGLISLAICDCLFLLEKLFNEVKVPKAVFDEVVIEGKTQSEILEKFLKDKIIEIDSTKFVIDAGNLGKGEIEAMALYKKLSSDFLLIDDLRARKIAELNEINIIGSLGVLLLGKKKGLIPKIKPIIQKIKKSDLYISEKLLDLTIKYAGEYIKKGSS